MQQMALEAIGKSPIKMCWGLIELDVPLGTSLHVINAEISLKARVAMVKFQQTFPDEYHFRTRLIDQALRYELCHVESVRLRGIHVISSHLLNIEQVPVLQHARQFLILSLLVAHCPDCCYPAVPGTSWSAQDDIAGFLSYEATHALGILLEKTLEDLLDNLQILLAARKRANWPVICFALSLIFFAAESMQVDIYLRSSNAPVMCEAMEMRSILLLAELFKASTVGFDPLCLDWTKEQNAELVENDEAAIVSLKALQNLSHDYCESWTSVRACFPLTVWKGLS